MTRSALVVSALLAVVGSATTPSGAASRTPTLSISTHAATVTSPVSLGRTDGWQKAAEVWTADLRTASTPGLSTVTSATWTSNDFHARRGQLVFRDRISVSHNGDPLASTSAMTDAVRTCIVGHHTLTCESWATWRSDTANSISPATLPFVASYAQGWDLTWAHAPALIRVQWRLDVNQTGCDEAHRVLQVAAGAAARRVQTTALAN